MNDHDFKSALAEFDYEPLREFSDGEYYWFSGAYNGHTGRLPGGRISSGDTSITRSGATLAEARAKVLVAVKNRERYREPTP